MQQVCYGIVGKSGLYTSESCISTDRDDLEYELEIAQEDKPHEDYYIVPLYAGDKPLERGAVRPTIVCLCGSTRFVDAFRGANLRETLAGNIVLSIGCNMKTDDEIFGHLPADKLGAIKARLDNLHLHKIDLADEVLILNVGGYIGESTQRELEYARAHGKGIRFLERRRAG
jgi:hypothetical protein